MKIKAQDTLQKGVLFTWKDERGFGFILPEDCGEDIFIHISAFGKINRRPKVGDIIYYHLLTASKGKYKAYNATIEGVKSQNSIEHKLKPRNHRISINTKKTNRLSRNSAPISFWKMIGVFMLLFIILIYGISKI
ncbi:cold shock domain-containing protein [Candidatus Halobeggiatoa sp. HSG11]|nr:cold shock domain-containing protein [Candidatus Halobeggiatoa sp. HSG11]